MRHKLYCNGKLIAEFLFKDDCDTALDCFKEKYPTENFDTKEESDEGK